MSFIRHSAATHVGHVRKVNEDSILVVPEQNIWVVADGMGGHAAGDLASQTIVDSIAMLPPGLPATDRMVEIRRAIEGAHAKLTDVSEARGGATIGSTVVALTIAADNFVAFWAGDSRLYLLRNGEIDMLTADHSLVAELVEAGEMSWDEAEHHPQSNAITRAVGVGGDEFELDKIRGEVMPGDRFLLCSDGLSKYAPFELLRRAMVGAPIETVVDKLMNIALKGGAADNISIIVIDVI